MTFIPIEGKSKSYYKHSLIIYWTALVRKSGYKELILIPQSLARN